MKKVIFVVLLALGVLAVSCSKSETGRVVGGGDYSLRDNFVYSYIVPDCYLPRMTTLRGDGKTDDGQAHPYGYYTFVMESYWADLNIGMDRKIKLVENSIVHGGGENDELYFAYAKEMGEAGKAEKGAYKGTQTLQKIVPVRVSGITVTANRDFDRDHPAGSDLTGMFGIRYVDPGDFIKSGYSEQYIRKYGIPGYDNMSRMNLIEFNTRQLKNLGHRLELYLLSKPVNTLEGFTFTFTYRDADGRTHIMQSEPVAIR